MKRIRYVSEFTTELSREELDELIEVSAANNRRDGITGVLVASGKVFFQLIEGPDEAIDACYDRILKDPRHTRVHALGAEQGDLERLCPDWAMNKVDLSREAETSFEALRALLNVISQQRDLIEELTKVLERVMWRELIEAEQNVTIV
jgi:hypothetical protein